MSVFTDERLGTWTVTRRDGRLRDWCNWGGQHVLAGQRHATWFSLSGDSRAPFASLVAEVHRALDHLEKIAAKANRELGQRAGAPSFADFYLARVSDWDEHDNILELVLLPIAQAVLDRDLTIFWPGDDELGDHHVVFRARVR